MRRIAGFAVVIPFLLAANAGQASAQLAAGSPQAAQPMLIPTAASTGARIEIDGGNIYILDGLQRRQLTSQGRDSDAVLSPDATTVAFTRLGTPAPADDPEHNTCEGPVDTLMRIGADGSNEETLLTGRISAQPEQQLCGFNRKQFSSDGRNLFFLSPAWATSTALHVFDMRAKRARFVRDANDVVVLSSCTDAALRDSLALQQHRYYVFGGSYDWYWLYDATGSKEVGPIGDAESAEALITQIEDSGRCSKP